MTFELHPDEGHEVISLDGSCSGSLDGNVFLAGPITEDCSIEVAFTLSLYTVSASAGEGGQIEPAGDQVVEHRQSIEFELSPEDGYEIDAVIGICPGTLQAHINTAGPINEGCTL